MRAAFPAFVGCVMAAAAVSAPPADAAYPFDDLPSLPPLPGVRTAAFSDDSDNASRPSDPRRVVPASYDGGFADEWASFDASFDDGYYADPYGDYPTTHRNSDTTRRLIERFSRLAAAEANQSTGNDPGFDPVYGPLDGDADFGPPTSFDGAFADGPPIWVGYVAATYMPGTDRTIWNGEWFAPLWQDGRNLWFFNLRGQLDDEDAGELNIGTGFRTLAWPGWVFGTYVFYDRLHSANDNGFNQGTFGVEAMDVLWDFRFNVYFPESKAKAVSTPASAAISDGTIVVRSGVERAYWGFDLETGHLLWAWGPNAQHEFRGFFGIYHFDHSAEGFDSITGPRVRFEWRCFDLPFFGLGSRLTCGFTAQADTERGGDLFAFTGLRIPLGWGNRQRPLTPLERRMLDPVIRDVDVVTNGIQRIEPAVNSHTGEVISRVHVLDRTDDLGDSIASADNNAVVVIDGSQGHILSDSAATLQPGQTVVGGGTQFDVRGALTGKPATWTAPGSRPTIEFGAKKDDEHGTAADDKPMTSGFQMADHTQLSSLNIRGGRPAVEIDEAEHVDLSDVDIRDAEGAGIALNKARHVKIEFVSIDDVDSETYVPNDWTNTDDQNNVFWAGPIHQGSGIAGVKSSDVTIRNSHIQETQQAGIKFFKSQDITVVDSVIEDTEGPGLSFLKTENVTVRNVELHDVGMYEGPTLETGPSDGFILLEAMQLADMPSTDWALKRAGIELRETLHTTIHNVAIRGAGSYGVWADGAVNTTLDAIDIAEVDHGMWFKNSQDVFISGAQIELLDVEPHWVGGWPEIGLFDFDTGETVESGGVWAAGLFVVPAQYHGIVLTDVTGSAAIRDSHIEGGPDGLGIWTRNDQDGALELTIDTNVIAGKPISLEAGGNSEVTARLWHNQIGGDGWSVNVDGSGQGSSNLGFLDNQLDGIFHALAADEREMNIALQRNQLSDGPHMISNQDDASVSLQYRDNRTSDEISFENLGSVFGLEPLSGNDHTPTQIGEITPLNPGGVTLQTPGIFN